MTEYLLDVSMIQQLTSESYEIEQEWLKIDSSNVAKHHWLAKNIYSTSKIIF